MKKINKKLLRAIIAFREVNFWFVLSLLAAILILLNYECGWITVNYNKGLNGLNTVAIQLLYAYLGGSIFYIFLEIIPKHKKRIALYRLLNNNILNTSDRIRHLFTEICHANNSAKAGDNISEKDFIILASSVNIHTTKVKTWFFQEDTMKAFVLRTVFEVKYMVEQITAYSELLNEKWVGVLSKMQDTIRQVEFHLDLNGTKSTFSTSGNFIWTLYVESLELERLFRTEFSKYYAAHRTINPPSAYRPEGLVFNMRKKH